MRSDAERLEAIRKTQEETRAPEGFDIREIACRATEETIQESRIGTFGYVEFGNVLIKAIALKIHGGNWVKRRRLSKMIANGFGNQHLKDCPVCRAALEGVMDYLKNFVFLV